MTRKADLNFDGTRKFDLGIWNFTRRDLYLENAKFGLVKFSVASLASLRKKQPFEVVFYFVIKGVGA